MKSIYKMMQIGMRVPVVFEAAISAAVSQMADQALTDGDVGPRVRRSEYIRRLVEADLRARQLWPPKIAKGVGHGHEKHERIN